MEPSTEISILNHAVHHSLQRQSSVGDNESSSVVINLDTEPLLPSDGNNVLLQIPADPHHANLAADDEEAQVFFIYNDVFTCGVCSKQCMDLVTFLQHKGTHCLAESIYKCELCKSIHTYQTGLIEHYHVQHGLTLEMDTTPRVNCPDTALVNGSHEINGQGMDAEKMTVLLTSPIPGRQELLEDSNVADLKETDDNAGKADEVNVTDLNGAPTDIPLIKMDMGSIVMPKTKAISVRHDRHDLSQPVVILDLEHVEQVEEEPADCGDGADLNDDEDNSEQVQPLEDSLDGPKEDTDDNNEQKKLNDVDFNFVLQTDEIKGKTLWYGRNSFKCLHCDFRSRTKARFKTHMYEKHQDMLPFHESLHASKGGDKDHKRVMKMSQYESMYCKRPRLTHGKKKRKLEKQDIPGVYPCVQCKKIFNRLRYLRKHEETHRTENKFICEDCGKSFKSRTYLRVHKRVHMDKVFQCNQCEFCSTINAAIQAHRQIHNQGSVICDICGYAYTDKSTLTKHKRVHDLSRPYACNFPGCTWRFKTEIMCRAHIRAHTTEGKFKCCRCGYVFRHKHHLQRHETNMHGIQHVKARGTQLCNAEFYENNNEDCELMPDSINVVIGGDISTEELGLSQTSLSCQQIVIATETQDNLEHYGDTADIGSLNAPYDTLMQHAQDIGSEHSEVMEGKAIMVIQPEAQIVFQGN